MPVPTVERNVERVLFASRWLLAPFYLGLIVTLGMLMVKFLQEVVHYVPHLLEMDDAQVIVVVLSLVDLTLVGSLILMVILSGYENFISKIEVAKEDRPPWMGTLDFGGLKLKLAASIVAISGIHLLKSFMSTSKADDRTLMWLLVIHLAFVVSGVLLALMDWITERTKTEHAKTEPAETH